MLYLLDANVLITASKTYYEIDRVPEFWAWLIHVGELGHVKIPQDVYDEVAQGTDDLAEWIAREDVQDALLLDEGVNVDLLRRVIDEGYAPNLTDEELERLGRDPFLIALAAADPQNRTIVTTEVSRPARLRANRHIPDVAAQFGVTCINTFNLTAVLDFKTNWQA